MLRCLLVLFLVAACGGTDLEKATKNASSDGDRPLVIMATASWCGPCQYFKKYVLPSPQVQEALGDVKFVMLDQASSKTSLRQLGVRSFPTFLVVRDDKVVARLQGGGQAGRFIDFLTWGVPNWFTKESLGRALEKQPSTRTRLYAARWLALSGNLPQAGKMYQAALAGLTASEEARRSTITWETILVGSVGATRTAFARRVTKFVEAFPRAHQVMPAVELALLSRGLPDAENQALAERALRLASENAQALNGLVFSLLAANLPELALTAAKRQVELSPGNANAYDTLAETHNALKQRDAALTAADKALNLETSADSKDAYRANRVRFAEGLPSKSAARTRGRAAKTLARFKIGQN